MTKQVKVAAEVAADNRIHLNLSQLFLADTNVRAGADFDQSELGKLVASIRSVGLLQPLVVALDASGNYGVVAGRRRLAALDLIASEDGGDPLVPVMIVDSNKAIEVSLAENYAREAMTTGQLYGAFKKFLEVEPDADHHAIAKAFGLPADRAARIMRLSLLHPFIMEAWDTGKIEDKTATAYAMTDNTDIQMAAWESLGEWERKNSSYVRSAIGKLLGGEEMPQGWFTFVGRDAYIEAGGRLNEDLFSDKVTVLDADTLGNLVRAKLDLKKAETESELRREDGGPLNIEWVEEAPQISRYGYMQDDTDLRVQPVPNPLSDEDQARIDEIETMAEDEGLTDDSEEWIEHEAIEAKQFNPFIIPEGKGKVVLHGKVSHKGAFEVRAYYADRDSAGMAAITNTTTKTASSGAGDSPAVAEKKALGTSRDGYLAMQALFGATAAGHIGEAASGGSSLGLDALLFGIAYEEAEYGRTSFGLPVMREPEQGNFKQRRLIFDEGAEPNSFDGLDAPWLKQLDMALAWDEFTTWVCLGENRNRLGAALLAKAWSTIVTNFREEPKPKFVQIVTEEFYRAVAPIELAELMPVAKAITLMSHKARVATMRGWGIPVDSLNALKKATSGPFMEKVLTDEGHRKLFGLDDESEAAVISWVPSVFEVTPVPRGKPKAEKKPRAKKAKAKAEVPEDEIVPTGSTFDTEPKDEGEE